MKLLRYPVWLVVAGYVAGIMVAQRGWGMWFWLSMAVMALSGLWSAQSFRHVEDQ